MGKPRLAPLVLLLAIARPAPSPAEDAAAIKALFKQYSPDASYVVEAYAKKSAEYGRKDFMAFWDGSSDDSRWRSYGRIVHECSIGFMEMDRTDGTMLAVARDKIYQLPWTEAEYSIILADKVPDRLKMSHYGILVDQSMGSGSLPLAHWAGVYGLACEETAYYLAAKTLWDLQPYLKSMGAKAPWGSYFQAIEESIAGIAEFKYYSLRYAVTQSRDTPQYFRQLCNNKLFAQALADLDASSAAFIDRYFAGKAEIYQSLRAAGQTVKEEDGTLVIGPKGAELRKKLSVAPYAALTDELSKPIYRETVARLSGGPVLVALPPYPGRPPSARGAAPTVAPVISEQAALALGGLNIGYGRRAAVIATQQMRALRVGLGKAGTSAAPGPGSAAKASSAPGQASAAPAQTAPQADQAESGPPIMTAAIRAVFDDIRAARPTKSARLSRHQNGDKGNVEVAAVDITGADIRLLADRLVCVVTFSSLAGELKLNNPGMGEGYMEYECAVAIDVRGDGKELYRLSLSWYKEADAKPLSGRPVDIVAPALYKESATTSTEVEAEASGYAEGSAIVLVLEDGTGLPLKRLTDKTRFAVSSYYDKGEGPVEDGFEL